MMVRLPPPSIARAEPKKWRGRCSALASTPPLMTRPPPGACALEARARRVSESSSTTTSLPPSTSRFAFSRNMSATWTWRAALSSKVEAITSPSTDRSMSVTSSGRSSTSSTMRWASGWLRATARARRCSRIVLPARGGATIRARWPKPIGATRSITRISKSFASSVSSSILRSGWTGVRPSKSVSCGKEPAGASAICSTRSSAK